MNKSPVFLGVYSKTTRTGESSEESARRWHVWSLPAGQFLIQEVFPGQDKEGEPERIDSSEFFNNFRVHAAFSSVNKGQQPKMPEAQPEPKTQPQTAVPKKEPAAMAEPASKSIFDELDDDDDGLSENSGQAQIFDELYEEENYADARQARAVVREGAYPMRPAMNEETPEKSSTFYTDKSGVAAKSSKPFIADLEQLEEQMRSDFSLALIRLQTNRDKALDSLNKIVDNKTNFRKEHKFMFSDFGTALRRRHLYSLAFRFHDRARELAPDDEHILFNMARAMFDSGKIEQARKYLQQAVAMASDFQAGTDFLEFIEGKYPQH